MMILPGILLGALVGLLSLIPGVHSATLMLSLLPLLGGDAAMVAAGTATGVGGVLAILHAVYHPVASSQLGSAEAAAQLAYAGQGRAAVKMHSLATEQTVYWLLWVGLPMVVLGLVGVPFIQKVSQVLQGLSPLLLPLLIIAVIKRASRPVRTALVMIAATGIGFITFHLPALNGSEWGLPALLTGLFSLPAGLSLLSAGKPAVLPRQTQWTPEDTEDGEEVSGIMVGVLASMLAGVGTGSIVSLLRRDEQTALTYQAMSSGAELGNNAWALLMFALTGSTRSGMAAAAGEAGAATDAWTGLIVIGSLIVGSVIGLKLLRRLEVPYHQFANKVNQRLLGLILCLTSLGLVVYTTGMIGLLIMAGAAALSSQARAWHVPNQALMLCMIGPVVLYQLGLVPSLVHSLGL